MSRQIQGRRQCLGIKLGLHKKTEGKVAWVQSKEKITMCTAQGSPVCLSPFPGILGPSPSYPPPPPCTSLYTSR